MIISGIAGTVSQVIFVRLILVVEYQLCLIYLLSCQIFSFFEFIVNINIEHCWSQLFLMPIFAPTLGEARLLSIGLFFHCLHVSIMPFVNFKKKKVHIFVNSKLVLSNWMQMFIYSIAWSSWVCLLLLNC